MLLSSHLLHEIEIIADDIVMIGNGRIVCQGSKSELLQATGTVVRAPDNAPSAGPWMRPVVDTTSTDDGVPHGSRPPAVGRVALGGARGSHRTASRRRRRARGDVPGG